jgi:hypothetical protein
MRNISVLDVGDGACSVLRERYGGDNDRDRTAIIDCGSKDRGARSAAQSLAQELSPRDWRSLSKLVVTHFDADHWEGLLRVVDIASVGVGDVPPALRIVFPAVPFGVDPQLPAAVMTLITTAGPFGVQALDLRAAWHRLTRLQLEPLARGDSFSLAGRSHKVVWPPERLDERATQRLNRLVQRIEEEAELLARNNYPQLRRSLHEAYQNGPYNRHPVPDEHLANDFRDSELPGLEAGDRDQWPQDMFPQDMPIPAIPPDWASKRDFKNLVKRARAAQNDLSLVFHDEAQSSLLVFGDAPAPIVERVREDLHTSGYQVALAPHHGSRRLWNSAPAAETCVSQGGRRMYQYWHNHKDTHLNSGDCRHTRDCGDIVRSMR